MYYCLKFMISIGFTVVLYIGYLTYKSYKFRSLSYTMTKDLGFMESVWWVFSELLTKGLVYRGFKVCVLTLQ